MCSNTEAAERGCGLPGVTEVTGNPNVTSGEPPVGLKTHLQPYFYCDPVYKFRSPELAADEDS